MRPWRVVPVLAAGLLSSAVDSVEAAGSRQDGARSASRSARTFAARPGNDRRRIVSETTVTRVYGYAPARTNRAARPRTYGYVARKVVSRPAVRYYQPLATYGRGDTYPVPATGAYGYVAAAPPSYGYVARPAYGYAAPGVYGYASYGYAPPRSYGYVAPRAYGYVAAPPAYGTTAPRAYGYVSTGARAYAGGGGPASTYSTTGPTTYGYAPVPGYGYGYAPTYGYVAVPERVARPPVSAQRDGQPSGYQFGAGANSSPSEVGLFFNRIDDGG